MLKRASLATLSAVLFLFLAGLFLSGSLPAAEPEKELIRNGALKSLDGWTIQAWMNPTNVRGEVIQESDGIKFKNTSANSRQGIMQTIDADVSGARSLILRAIVKANVQTLNGTGWQGREAPVAVMVTYTDIQGVKRVGLGSMANPVESQLNRMFWRGFYYVDPTGNSRNWNGSKVGPGQWFTYQIDLMTLNPKPKIIHAVGAEGSGWPNREGKIQSISLRQIGEAPSATIEAFTWIDKNTDKVGQGANGRPDGTMDGQFRIQILLPAPMEITSIAVYSANDAGAPTGGQIWHSKAPSYWVLGVFNQNRQINPSHINTLGNFTGRQIFDLYCNDSGWFKSGQSFLVEVEYGGGRKATKVVKLPVIAPPPINEVGVVIFDNGNIQAVQNNPTRPTTFTISLPHKITYLQDYHWNNGRGSTSGRISFRHNDGRVFGPWQTAGYPGQGGVPNAYWRVAPNVEIPAGTYTVVDSEPATWSHNAGNQNTGMSRILGQATGVAPPPINEVGVVIFDNGNIQAVQNNPTRQTMFNIAVSHRITYLQDYHWNNARGSAPGRISFHHSDGRVFGPWQTAGYPGQGGVPNAFWRVAPNVEIPAGTYTVIDSEPATWSQNAGNQNTGMSRILGQATGVAPPPPPPAGMTNFALAGNGGVVASGFTGWGTPRTLVNDGQKGPDDPAPYSTAKDNIAAYSIGAEPFQVNFRQQSEIRRIGIMHKYGGGGGGRDIIRQARLVFSDGSSQQIAFNQAYGLQYLDITPKATQFIRVEQLNFYPGSDRRWGVIEFEAWGNAAAQPVALNLSGPWNCDDGGRYYIRQLGTKVWWFGERAPTNPSWSNVAYGDIVGNELRLNWADVPKGSILSSGALVLDVTANRLTAKQKTGGFGGSVWTR